MAVTGSSRALAAYRGVPRGLSTPAVGVIDHKTRRMKFSVYQHYRMPESTSQGADLAFNMSASEALFVFKPVGTETQPENWRARIPSFYNVAQKWMTFEMTGMKMTISAEGGTHSVYSGTDILVVDHQGGAWSTVWNETEGVSHKPMSQYVDNVHGALDIVPRWDFQKEAKWEDKSYRAARFRAVVGGTASFMKNHRRPFFSRYSRLRSPKEIGQGDNGIHVDAARRQDWLPVLHLHQADQFMQYQVNNFIFSQSTISREIRFRVKKTWYVTFADKREMRNIATIANVFRPHEDETYTVKTEISSAPFQGCTDALMGCELAGDPKAGPAPDPGTCCEATCVPLVCGPGEIPASVDAVTGCVDSCLPGTSGPGPCFETPGLPCAALPVCEEGEILAPLVGDPPNCAVCVDDPTPCPAPPVCGVGEVPAPGIDGCYTECAGSNTCLATCAPLVPGDSAGCAVYPNTVPTCPVGESLQVVGPGVADADCDTGGQTIYATTCQPIV